VTLETTNGSAQTVGDEFIDASRVFLRQDFLMDELYRKAIVQGLFGSIFFIAILCLAAGTFQ